MAICEKCKHNGICKHEENMKEFEKEIREKERLLEYKDFRADVKCEHYYDLNNTLNFPQGCR